MNSLLFLLAAVLLLLMLGPQQAAQADSSGTTHRSSDTAWRKAVSNPAAAHLARPTAVQYDWQGHKQEDDRS